MPWRFSSMTRTNKNKPKKIGRPRKPVFEWPVFDSMAACAAATGTRLTMLKAAKREGCQAFRHSRVYFGDFYRWLIESDGKDPDIDWGRELKKVQTLRDRIRLAEDEKRVIDFEVVRTGIRSGMSILFSELDRVFLSEMPSMLKGLDEIGIRDKADEQLERLREMLRERFHEIGSD